MIYLNITDVCDIRHCVAATKIVDIIDYSNSKSKAQGLTAIRTINDWIWVDIEFEEVARQIIDAGKQLLSE